ncbi:hypothetical protein ACLOJK_008231 [Asimina triloba]
MEEMHCRVASASLKDCLIEGHLFRLLLMRCKFIHSLRRTQGTLDDMGRICQIYDSFLSEFPLCYGYWKKYADHWARLCDISKAVEVYEQAVQSATYSVHIWVNYCSFGMLSFEDPADVRRLFERGISFVGKDYLSYLLWDKYIEFEYSQKQWGYLAHVYIRTISFPTKKLQSYYESFKTFAAIWEEEIISQNRDAAEVQSETLPVCEIPEAKACEGKEILRIIQDLLDPGAGIEELKKFLSAGIHFYQRASDMDAKIKGFENHIRRPYFHVKLLDDVQLENWHHYLDFVELQGDFDWAVKLYERCLIPCANYPEFWIRYVEFVEDRGGREIANLALARATQVFLKPVSVVQLSEFLKKAGNSEHKAFLLPTLFPFYSIIWVEASCSASDLFLVHHMYVKRFVEDCFWHRITPASGLNYDYDIPACSCDAHDLAWKQRVPGIHLFCAKFKEQIGDILGARAAFLPSSAELSSDFIDNVKRKANMEKRLASGDVDAARDVLMRGLQHLPHSKFLLEVH